MQPRDGKGDLVDTTNDSPPFSTPSETASSSDPSFVTRRLNNQSSHLYFNKKNKSAPSTPTKKSQNDSIYTVNDKLQIAIQ
jgi:hypothetical protein